MDEQKARDETGLTSEVVERLFRKVTSEKESLGRSEEARLLAVAATNLETASLFLKKAGR